MLNVTLVNFEKKFSTENGRSNLSKTSFDINVYIA